VLLSFQQIRSFKAFKHFCQIHGQFNLDKFQHILCPTVHWMFIQLTVIQFGMATILHFSNILRGHIFLCPSINSRANQFIFANFIPIFNNEEWSTKMCGRNIQYLFIVLKIKWKNSQLSSNFIFFFISPWINLWEIKSLKAIFYSKIFFGFWLKTIHIIENMIFKIRFRNFIKAKITKPYFYCKKNDKIWQKK